MSDSDSASAKLEHEACWVDTHCHLDRFVHNGTLEKILANARANGVGQLVVAGTSPEDWELYRSLHREHPGHIRYSVGIHPNEVDADFEQQIATLETFFKSDAPPCAVGEVGLDYYRLPQDSAEAARATERQQRAFILQIRLALAFDKPLIIHARNAFADTVRLLEENRANWEKVVFHCFAEGPDPVLFLRERGAWASFTGVLTYNNAEITRQACLAQGLERLMLETDCPYLCPMPLRGKENEPANLPLIGNFAAGLFNVSPAEAAAITTRNARVFFGF